MDFSLLESGFVGTRHGKLHYMKGTASSKGALQLVLLHGLGADSRSWKRFIEAIQDNFDILALDLLGHGDSDAPQLNYNIGVQAECLYDALAGIGSKDYMLVGHSYGGWIAAYYCTVMQDAKAMPKKLVLEDAAGLKEQFDEVLANGSIGHFYETELNSVMKMNNNKEFVMKSTIYGEVKEHFLTKESLLKLDVPTLIIWGGKDRIIDARIGKLFQERIRNSELAIVDAGHVPHVAKPGDVANLIEKFALEVHA